MKTLLVLSLTLLFQTFSAADTRPTQGPFFCIREVPELKLSPLYQFTEPGQVVDYSVTVTNTDSAGCEAAEFLNIAYVNDSASLGSTADPHPFFTPERFTLKPGETMVSTLQLSIPAEIWPLTYSILVEAQNLSSNLSAEKTATLEIPAKVCYSTFPQVIVSPESQIVHAGGTIEYKVVVTNLDTADCLPEEFLVSATTSGVSSDYALQVFPERLMLSPGSSGESVVKVTVPNNPFPGIYSVSATARKSSSSSGTTASSKMVIETPH